MKFGACHIHPKCNSDNRFKIHSKESGLNYSWFHRTIVNHNKFSFGILGVYNISRKVFEKNDLLVKYSHDANTDFILKASCDGFRKNSLNIADWSSYFDVFKFDFVRKVNDTTRVGLEVAINPRG